MELGVATTVNNPNVQLTIPRDHNGHREFELGASVAMIRVHERESTTLRKMGGWAGRACKSQVWSRLLRTVWMRVRGVWRVCTVLRTRVSGDVGPSRTWGTACCAAASDPMQDGQQTSHTLRQ
jgi:hypothetical protein